MSDKATITITKDQSQIILYALKKAPVTGPVEALPKFLEQVAQIMEIVSAPFQAKEEKKEDDLGIEAEIK